MHYFDMNLTSIVIINNKSRAYPICAIDPLLKRVVGAICLKS